MDQPIQDRISDSRVADVIMPVLDGKLASDKGGATAVALLGHFKKISTFGIVQRRQCQIVKDEQMGFGESLHESSVTAIGPGESDLIEELRGSEIEGSEAFTAGFLSHGTGKEGLASARGTGDEKVLVIADPVTGDKIHHHGFLYSPGCFVVNVLDRGLKFEFGLFEELFETFVFLPDPLTIHEHPEAFIEGEIVGRGLL